MNLLRYISFLATCFFIIFSHYGHSREWINDNQYFLLEASAWSSIMYYCVLTIKNKWISLVAIFMFLLSCHNFIQELTGVNTEYNKYEWVVGGLYFLLVIVNAKEFRKLWIKD